MVLTQFRALKAQNKSGFAVLADPDKIAPADMQHLARLCNDAGVDFLFLGGQHVASAPQVKASGLEVISTGYIIIDGGTQTTVSYMSNTTPVPADKPEIALCTAWAGELQGKHVIYVDAGSGARRPVSKEMISKISSNIAIPLIADIVVVGNAIERDPMLIRDMAQASKAVSVKRNV